MVTKVILPKLHCERCAHDWIPRSEKVPRHCPKCHSPYWNKPRGLQRGRPRNQALLPFEGEARATRAKSSRR